MKEEHKFEWVFENHQLKTVKQPAILTPDEFLDLVERIDNDLVDPLIALRNQCMLLMTFFSCFRAVEVSQWKVKEAITAGGTLKDCTKLRVASTKGNKPALVPVLIKEQREYLERWFNARVKYKLCVAKNGSEKYRGLDPESHVFLSNHHGRWQNFSMTKKVTKGKEYYVATAVQNLLTKLYKEYGFPDSSSHSGRHSFSRFVKMLLEREHDPNISKIIKGFLHHRTDSAQRDYTDLNFKHIIECSKKMMPKPKRGRPRK